jgi:CPA1 family monovalent cation:H+ antiporter
MLRRIGLPGPIQAVFAGESLFNDGVGVVVFGVALGVATGDGSTAGGTEIATRFVFEALGGSLLGLALGWVAVQFMRAVDDAHLELILSLVLATGAFSLVARFSQIEGYRCLSLTRAFGVVKCRLALELSWKLGDDGLR